MALTYYLDEDGINLIPVTTNTPLPVTGGGDPSGGHGSSPEDPIYAAEVPVNVLGSQFIASLAASTALTVPTGTLGVGIQNAGSMQIRWKYGATPTATEGFILPPDGSWQYWPVGKGHIDSMRFIESASGAQLNVVYYR